MDRRCALFEHQAGELRLRVSTHQMAQHLTVEVIVTAATATATAAAVGRRDIFDGGLRVDSEALVREAAGVGHGQPFVVGRHVAQRA